MGTTAKFTTKYLDAHFAEGDRTRVKQVLINLLSNAIKYNKVGGTVVVDYIASTTRDAFASVSRTPAKA